MKAYIVDSTGNVITIRVVLFPEDRLIQSTTSDRRKVVVGYKGHRVGTMREKLHQIFDKYGVKNLEKAKAEAARKTKASPATINTTFSRFRALTA